jgi:phage recombination protein Bet
MTEGNEIQPAEVTPLSPTPVQFTKDQTALLKRTICRGATDDELSMFLHVCKRMGMDPFARQIHAVKRWNSKENREVMSVQVAIDGYRLIAERTGKFQGRTEPEWCDADGVWVKVWLKEEHPHAARVGVWKQGFKEPTYSVVYYDQLVQKRKDGTPTEFWHGKKGVHQLAKCAESDALRSAFPQELGGTYTDEEMSGAEPPEVLEAREKNLTVEEFIEAIPPETKERLRKIGCNTLAKVKALVYKSEMDTAKLDILISEAESNG